MKAFPTQEKALTKCAAGTLRCSLSIAFDTTAESRLGQQLQYDLARAETKRRTLKVKKLTAA